LMPDAAERTGDFSRVLNPLGEAVQLIDPSTGSPIPGNRIPQSQINPHAKALLDLYPSPNFAGGTRYNYQIPIVSIVHQDSLQTRLNKTIGRRDQVSGGFAFQSTRSDSPNLFGFLDTS